MKIYISGPITGMPAGNRPAFRAAELQIAGLGHMAINPHGYGDMVEQRMIPRDPSWADYMRACIAGMMCCDGVALLDGWEHSRGACIEVDLARSLGMPCKPVNDWPACCGGQS